MIRGQVWWAELPNPLGSEPGYTHPIIIIQADTFNRSQINTVIALIVTSNLRAASMPGNVSLLASKTGLKRDSVANVSQVVTVDRQTLREKIGQLDYQTMQQIDEGIRLVLAL